MSGGDDPRQSHEYRFALDTAGVEAGQRGNAGDDTGAAAPLDEAATGKVRSCSQSGDVAPCRAVVAFHELERCAGLFQRFARSFGGIVQQGRDGLGQGPGHRFGDEVIERTKRSCHACIMQDLRCCRGSQSMKKALIAIGALLLLAALVLPGVVGIVIEREVQSTGDRRIEVTPGVEVATTALERGWFASRITNEVHITDASVAPEFLRSIAATDARLVLDSNVRHGLVLADWVPVLAVARSAATLVDGTGDTAELPGDISARVGLLGALSLRYRIDDLSMFDERYGQVTIGEAETTLTVDRTLTSAHGGGFVEDLTMGGQGGRGEIDDGRLDFALERHPATGLWVGEQQLSFGRLRAFDGAGNDSGGLDGLSARGVVAITGNFLRLDADMAIDRAVIEGSELTDLRLEARVERLDAAAVAALQAAAKTLEASVGAGVDPAAANPQLVEQLMTEPLYAIVRGGPAITIEEMTVTVPEGTLAVSVDVALPEMAADASVDPVTVLEGAVGEGQLVMDKPVAQWLARLQPANAEQLRMAIATGFIVDTGDSYRMDLAYEAGMLTVNGNPMPVPLEEMFPR